MGCGFDGRDGRETGRFERPFFERRFIDRRFIDGPFLDDDDGGPGNLRLRVPSAFKV